MPVLYCQIIYGYLVRTRYHVFQVRAIPHWLLNGLNNMSNLTLKKLATLKPSFVCDIESMDESSIRYDMWFKQGMRAVHFTVTKQATISLACGRRC